VPFHCPICIRSSTAASCSLAEKLRITNDADEQDVNDLQFDWFFTSADIFRSSLELHCTARIRFLSAHREETQDAEPRMFLIATRNQLWHSEVVQAETPDEHEAKCLEESAAADRY
jgi:hypothetical protein